MGTDPDYGSAAAMKNVLRGERRGYSSLRSMTKGVERARIRPFLDYEEGNHGDTEARRGRRARRGFNTAMEQRAPDVSPGFAPEGETRRASIKMPPAFGSEAPFGSEPQGRRQARRAARPEFNRRAGEIGDERQSALESARGVNAAGTLRVSSHEPRRDEIHHDGTTATTQPP